MSSFRRMSPGQGVHGGLAWLNRPGALWGSIAVCTLLFFALHWPSSSPADSPKPVELKGTPSPATGGAGGAQTAAPAAAPAAAASGGAAAALPGAPADKVLLELFVMSRCPDANLCEHVFDGILDKAGGIAHVQPRYIQYASSGGDVSCMHGEEECTANVYQACVARHAPAARNREWLMKFLICAWDGGVASYDRGMVKTCLDKVGAKDAAMRSAVDACIDGEEGKALARAHAAEVKARGIERSCTVAIEGVKRCVRDGGRWYDCEGGSEEGDFVASLCAAYAKKTGAAAPAEVCGRPAAAAAATGR
ncbi:hypothetical protein Rsub_04470 [Raphidocelis subcapitata]|uniref:Gamma-interferon-inducible lysosomal thiol reductase n=1 Tax=Raphidocelis subcapitata TaxID=307507 RepID=A0A2V0P2P8_9CHLO|nr:hypothetical protein Rsub_04470 [Raphidocelis subcapitata]|eukprot:GBF92123.1 hypothetical protein Rsub_04470 [Raphidocelis subcapitata]